MSSSLRLNLKQSQISEGIKRQPLKINLLNINQLARSLVRSNDQNSEKLTNKRSKYKYERINNSFRLVQIDQIQSQNKQNHTQYSKQENDSKNFQILPTLNSLSQRISKLQRNQNGNVDQLKIQFLVHKYLQKILNQQKQEKNMILNTKIDKINDQINKIRQEIKSYSILPSYIADSQQYILKKCKSIIEEEIKVKNERNKEKNQGPVQINQKYSMHRLNQTVQQRKLEEYKNYIQNIVVKMNNNLQKYVQSELKTWQNYNKNIIKEISYMKQVKAQFQYQIQKANARINKLIQDNKRQEPKKQQESTELRKKCNKNLIGILILSMKIRQIKKQSLHEDQNKIIGKDIIQYGIDPEGYLVDSDGYYLTNKKNDAYKLTNQQIKKICQAGILCIRG